MGLKRWTGSGYADVDLGHAEKALVWDGSEYVQVWPTSMPFSFVGASSAIDFNPVSIPAHQPGDLLVIAGGGLSTPTAASGWTSAFTGGGGLINVRVGYKIATSTSESPVTWTDASSTVCGVWRGPKSVRGVATGGSGSSISFPALTLTATGQSWTARMSAATSGIPGQPTTAPRTVRLAANRCGVWDSDGYSTANIAAGTSTAGGSPYWGSVTIELLP